YGPTHFNVRDSGNQLVCTKPYLVRLACACGSQGAVALLKNPVESQRSKHIAVMHHMARERVWRGEVQFTYCPTADMVADVLTKALPGKKFLACKEGMGRRVLGEGIGAFVADNSRVGPDFVEVDRDGAIDDEGSDSGQDVVVPVCDERHRVSEGSADLVDRAEAVGGDAFGPRYMADGTPTGETPGAGTSADPDNFRGLLALARTDPNFRRDLQAALNPAGTSANHSRPGTGPLDDELLNDEEEVEDEEPDEDEEEEDEAEQLREELAATRMELNSLRIRQRNMDRALSSLAGQAVPGPDKWTDACAKSVRRASAFCDDLEAHCARYSLDIVSVFPAFLSGAARNAWYPSVQQAHFAQTGVAPPWQFLRASFLEYTGDDLRDDMLEARDRLLDRSIRMGPNYPELSEYLIAFRNNLLTAGAQCMDESLLVNLFVTGLSPSLRETVLKDIVPLQNPTLTQAIDSARQAQRNAVFLAGAVSSKRHVAAVQGRAITEQAEHEINDANRTLGLAGRQATTAAPRPAGRTAPRRGGMRPGPPPAAAGKKAGAAAAATAVKPGQYCHHCYSPDHLKPQCPWKHLPAKQAREQSGYSRPPPGANPEKQTDALCVSMPANNKPKPQGPAMSAVDNCKCAVPVSESKPEKTAVLAASFAGFCCEAADPCLSHVVSCKTALCCPMLPSQVILGVAGQDNKGALIDYVDQTLTLRTAQGNTTLHPHTGDMSAAGQCVANRPPGSTHSLPRPPAAVLAAVSKANPKAFVTAKQAARWLRKGGSAMVAMVSLEDLTLPADVSPVHRQHLQALLDEYSDVFEPITGLPPERAVGHSIPLQPDAKPPARPSYRMSKPEHDELRRQITDLLAKGLIEPSSSPFAAPVLFVQKKSGELRMCIDYRQLNKITIRDQYPLPRIDDLFDQLAGKTVFSSLDLQAGYHQIRIPAEDVPKTAFRTPEGHYQFKVLCFGLTNAPATFQRVMNEAFAEVINDCALVYLDDILVMSENTEQHLVHLRRVFDLLRKNKFYAKLSKCEFMKRTLMFLGHIISAQGISVDPCKVTAISNWPVPTSLKTLQSFLGIANYVRKFVHNFSTIAAPLTNLTGPKKDSFPWKAWPQAELDAFNALKQAISNVPMLKLPDHSKPFQVHCDASLEGIGAVLMQDGYPLAYYSRKLIPAEVNYTTGEQELLALVSACQQWRCYLEGVPFTLYTDHRPLISLPTQNILSRRQTRWMEFLARFSYTIEYLPGISNPADPLSRIPAATVQTCKGPGADNVKSILVMTRSKRRSQEGEETGAEARKTSAGDAAVPPTQPPPGQGDGAAVRPPTKRVTWAADVPADGEPSAPKPPGPLSNLHEWLVRAYAADSNFTKRRKTKNYYLDDNGLWRHNKRRTVIVPRDKQLREHILHEMHDAKKSSDSVFQVGDRVLLSTMNLRNMVGKARKLLPRYVGPFRIEAHVGCPRGLNAAAVRVRERGPFGDGHPWLRRGMVRELLVAALVPRGGEVLVQRQAHVLFVAAGGCGWLALIRWSVADWVCVSLWVEGGGSASQPSLGIAFGDKLLSRCVPDDVDVEVGVLAWLGASGLGGGYASQVLAVFKIGVGIDVRAVLRAVSCVARQYGVDAAVAVRLLVASGNQATILDDDNWPIWSIRTEGLLIEAGLWSVVTDGVTPLPTAPAPNATQEERAAYAVELARSRADSALDRKAKAFIQRHVSNLHIFTVKSADSAQDAWETLESQFTESSVARQSQLQQQLSLLRMEPGESVARFYARLQQLLTELEACNCETSESTVVLAILAALPPEYESTVERLRYDQTSSDLKVERIKRVLLTKEADLLSKQMQQQLSTSSSSLWSYSSPSDSRGGGSSGGQGGRGRFRLPQQSREQQQQQQARAQSPDRSSREVSSHAHLTCNYCAKPGHIMSECFTFDRDQRNRMRTLFSNSARTSSPGRRPSPGRSSSPAARASSPSRGRAQTPGRTAAQSPSRGASLFTCSTAAAADDDDDDLDDVLMQMVQPKLNFNSDLYSPFCIDSGASQHILKDLQFFYNYTPFAPDKHRPVRLAAEGHRVWAVGSGSVFLSTKRGSWYLSHALYVPDSKQNFISVTAATDEGSSFLFRGDVCQISCNQFGSMLRVNAHKVKNSYILAAVPMPDGPDTDSEQEQGAKLYGIQQSALQPDPRIKLELLTNVPAPSANSTTSNSPQVWHQRLCHTSYDALARMQSAGMVSGVPVTAAQFRAAASDPAVCVGCVKGKQHKNVAFAGPPPNAAPVTAPLGLIHMDVCGPMHARARDGSLYVATFLDEYTKLSVCVPISSKAQVPDTVRTVIEELETQSGYRCKAIRTDNGTEYVNSRMKEYCASKGIVHQHSAPYSPQQNGAAERLNRTIFEKARSIIHSADISLSFWAHAVKFANHVRCLLPVSGQPLTPWEAFYGVKPDLSGLRVFGCRVWLHIPDHQRSKLQAKSVEGLFIGYEPGSKAYRVLVNGRETCSKDIVFDELSVLQPTRQQDQPAQPVFLLPLPPSPTTPSEPLTPAAPAEGGNSLQQTSSSSSEDSGSSSSSISRPGSSAQRPQSRPLEGVGAHQDSSSPDSPPSEQEPSQQVSLTARYEPGSHMWHQQQLELISKLPRPGIGRFSLRSMPLARETVGAQPAAAPAAARPAAPAAAPAAARPAAPAAAPVAARPAAPAAAPTAARPAAPVAAPPAAPAAVRPSASATAPTAARPAASAARPAAAARPGLAQPALRVPLIPTSATARQAAPAVHPSMPMPPAPDPRPASPEAPAAPVPRRNPSRERHRPERFRDSDLFAMNVSDSPVNDTPTVAEALAGPMADLWIEAMNAELASLHANQTWCLEERPANARVLPTKWVLKVKRDAAGNIEKLKARLVAKGFYQQSGVDVGDVYAPVSKHTTLRTLLAKAAAENMEIHQLDFETAFLNGKLEPGEVIYVQQPEGFEEGSTNTVCRLQKALYGLRQAPRAWHARLCEELLSMGFKASEADPALFTLQLSTGMVYLLVYVDDCLLCTQQGDTAGLAHVKKQLSAAFKLKDLGEARWFLGMQLTRDRAEGTIKLDQHKFIQELVTANSKSAAHSKPLPMAPAVKLVREGDALDTTLHHYSALVGSLLYLTCCTRPDIAFAVGALARHMSAPTKQHWAAACSVLCYLKGTADQGLLFGGVSGLQGFSDADYAGDKDTARSTTGYIFTLNGGAISWSSRLQPTVAMSTAEAEYMAASSAAKEALWLRKLMRDLQLDASCVHLGCDNQAAIQLLHNPMATSRAKHIDVHHHFVRERISRGEVAFHYCHTSSMLADILTKPLAAVQFNMGKQGCGVFS
ncbi:hypothetical protein QJQ45_015104, partial [Haematococcus lacustris]